MNRRELLGAVGLGASGIAGFVGASADGAGQATTGTTEATSTAATETTTTDGGFTGLDSNAERPFATISVGTREGVRNSENNLPHVIRVWNDSERPQTVGLMVVRAGEAGSALVDRRVEFPADGYLTIRLLEPATYWLRIIVGDAVAGEMEIPRSQFDCNDSRTDVAVTPDGRVRSATVTTEIGCPPEVTDRTFTAFGGSCGSANRASVSFGENSVAVRGSIQVPNPCYGAELAEVTTPAADVLRVAVAATDPAADVCAQCLGTVEYRADLGFRDRVPGTVEVAHRRGDRTETVATVTRDGETTTEASERTATTTET